MNSNAKTPFPDDAPSTSLHASHMVKAQFGARVYKLMVKKGWSQSKLAQVAGLERDRVSNYVRGKVLPRAENLEVLAKALGVTPEELLPDVTEQRMNNDPLLVDLKVSPQDPNSAWLRINRLVPLATALKILEIINDECPTTSGE